LSGIGFGSLKQGLNLVNEEKRVIEHFTKRGHILFLLITIFSRLKKCSNVNVSSVN